MTVYDDNDHHHHQLFAIRHQQQMIMMMMMMMMLMMMIWEMNELNIRSKKNECTTKMQEKGIISFRFCLGFSFHFVFDAGPVHIDSI